MQIVISDNSIALPLLWQSLLYMIAAKTCDKYIMHLDTHPMYSSYITEIDSER